MLVFTKVSNNFDVHSLIIARGKKWGFIGAN